MEVIIGILILCVAYFLFLHFRERIRPKDEKEEPEKGSEITAEEETKLHDNDSSIEPN